eukprot:scaffold1146_cov399-Prasinococcus_capsulatus_cf.AAC.77
MSLHPSRPGIWRAACAGAPGEYTCPRYRIRVGPRQPCAPGADPQLNVNPLKPWSRLYLPRSDARAPDIRVRVTPPRLGQRLANLSLASQAWAWHARAGRAVGALAPVGVQSKGALLAHDALAAGLWRRGLCSRTPAPRPALNKYVGDSAALARGILASDDADAKKDDDGG